MKSFLVLGLLCFSGELFANHKCEALFIKSPIRSSTVSNSSQILGFTNDPNLLQQVQSILESSKVRPQIHQINGFNNKILQKAPRIEKLIRQETPFTVSLMGREVMNQLSTLSAFTQIGFVYGDPHFGNSNSQPNVFRGLHTDRNRYTLVDLDEVSVGIFSLDMARYSIFLKASFGKLNKYFNDTFENKLFESYLRGLKQDKSMPIPAFIQKSMNATPEAIREKINKYGIARTEPNGKFKSSLYNSGELQEFTTKNMKPQFLEKMHFDRKKQDRSQFKESIFKMMAKTAQSELGDNVQILDIAIPFRDSGGSADNQRFLISTEVHFEGQKYRMILEFKENVDISAWDAVIDTPLKSSADRYNIALKITTDDGGPFLKVVEFSPEVSFLMRPKGNIDIEFKTKSEIEELALFNAYTMGLFHGGQKTTSSVEYIKNVSDHLPQFQQAVTDVASKVLKNLTEKSGLKIPKIAQ